MTRVLRAFARASKIDPAIQEAAAHTSQELIGEDSNMSKSVCTVPSSSLLIGDH